MNNQETKGMKPRVAVVDTNVLVCIGLKHMLQEVMPFMEVDTFGSFAELEANDPNRFFHYFVETNIVVSNMNFFTGSRHKTIVLSPSADPSAQLTGFHTLCTHQPESGFVRQLLQLEQHAHGHGQNLPPVEKHAEERTLTEREVEVLALVVKGKINKEIADALNISVTTVITHRKNIQEKLGVKSVSALTIYAVMHGIVSMDL